MWCLIQFLFTCQLYLSSFFLFFPFISPLLLPLVSCSPMSSPKAPPQWRSSSFFTSVLFFSLIVHFPPLWASLSSYHAARHKDTVMLSLLGWQNSTSLCGVKALTLPCPSVCLPVCVVPLSAPVNLSWLIGCYLSSCWPASLPTCPTSCRGEWSSDKWV